MKEIDKKCYTGLFLGNETMDDLNKIRFLKIPFFMSSKLLTRSSYYFPNQGYIYIYIYICVYICVYIDIYMYVYRKFKNKM